MKKVSIITPCYNGEKYLKQYFEGLLSQSYSFIELIFIDDGSNDETQSIYYSYEKKLIAKGIETQYVFQKNEGQAAALNRGLKMFSGDYLMWPDADDIMTDDNIMEKVKFLDENPDIDIVFCEGEIVADNDLNNVTGVLKRNINIGDKDDIFSDYIYEKNVVFPPIAYMVRSTAVDDYIKDREIYKGRQGQNWQMLLPILYSGKWGYIEKKLYKYVVRNDSHSHEKRTYEQQIARFNGFEAILLNTLDRICEMPTVEREKWKIVVYEKYLSKKLYLAYHNKDKKMIKKYRMQQKKLGLKQKYKYGRIYCFARNLVYGEKV